MRFLNTFALAAPIALSLAAPAPVPVDEAEPTSIDAAIKDAFDALIAKAGPSHTLATRGDWGTICKNENVGNQVCLSVVSRAIEHFRTFSVTDQHTAVRSAVWQIRQMRRKLVWA